MSLKDLPLVLRDLITVFAWGKKSHESFLIACIASEVNHWSIPEVFIRRHHFDWQEMRSAVSPLQVFNASISPEDWFREDICFMLLQMLDFRRKTVRAHGDRRSWMKRMRRDWTTIVPFSEFYSGLLADDANLEAIRSADIQEPVLFLRGPPPGFIQALNNRLGSWACV